MENKKYRNKYLVAIPYKSGIYSNGKNEMTIKKFHRKSQSLINQGYIPIEAFGDKLYG